MTEYDGQDVISDMSWLARAIILRRFAPLIGEILREYGGGKREDEEDGVTGKDEGD